MGNKNVGKTSIIQSFLNNASMKGKPKDPTKVMSDFTRAMTVTDKEGRNHELTLNIWDAAGDVSVHNLAHLFLNSANVAVLCYAIDDKRSFDQLHEWAEHLRDKEDEMFIVIVGSKSDLVKNRAVPSFHAMKLKNEYKNCKFTTETSAYENIETIEQLFSQIGQLIIEEKRYTEK